MGSPSLYFVYLPNQQRYILEITAIRGLAVKVEILEIGWVRRSVCAAKDSAIIRSSAEELHGELSAGKVTSRTNAP